MTDTTDTTDTADVSSRSRVEPLPLPDWPGGADVAVSLTVDVDAEAPLVGLNTEQSLQVSPLAEAQYSIASGLPRLRRMLGEVGVPATFYVPGYTATTHGDRLMWISADGHEVGHHGHLHLDCSAIDPDSQDREFEEGLAALREVFGLEPRGYRAPNFALTARTCRALVAAGLLYDSSCMGADYGYVQHVGPERVLELPVHWSLDDGVYYAWSPATLGHLPGPTALYETWLREFEAVLEDGGHLTLVVHPHWSGRPHQAATLHRLLQAMKVRARVWFATHLQIAERYALAESARTAGTAADL